MAKLTIETDKDDGMNLWDALRKMLTTTETEVIRGKKQYDDYDTFFAPYESRSPMQLDIPQQPQPKMPMFDQPLQPQALPPINPMDTMGLPMGPQLPY